MTETKIRISAIDATQAAFRSVQNNVGKLKGALGGVGGQVAAAFSVAAITAYSKSILNAADSLAKLSQKTGISVEDLSSFQLAADLAGVGADQFSQATVRLNKSIADAIGGSKQQQEAFQKLGITQKELATLSPAQTLERIADAFSGAEDGANKTQIAMALLGKSGADLIPLLNGGSEALRQFGSTVSTDFAKNAEIFNDNIRVLSENFRRFFIQILGPIIENINRIFGTPTGKELERSIEAAQQRVNDLNDAIIQTQILGKDGLFKKKDQTIEDYKKQLEAARKELERLVGLRPKDRPSMPQTRLGALSVGGTAQKDPLTAQLEEQNQQFIENLRLLGLLDTAEITRDNKLRALNALTKDGLITKKQELDILFQIESGYSDATEAIAKYSEATEVLNQNTQDLNDNMRFFAITLQDVGVTTMYSLEDAIFSVMTKTKSLKEAFKDMARAVISDLIRMYIRMKITIPLFNAFFGTTGTPAPISTIPIPARAMGGPVTGGRPYMVGEKGPELFVPERSGTIVPNNSMGGVVVNQTINVTTGVQQTVRTEIAALLPQISSAAKAAVLDAKQRGGAFAAAF
jgi:hypothetical protein